MPTSELFRRYQLVVFDVDGTLYEQKPLRLTMLRLLLGNVLKTRSLTDIRVLRDYRKRRETLGDAETQGFEKILTAQTAVATGVSETTVNRIVSDWIETRPLPYLKANMYSGAADLFSRLRASGVTIGVLSDYPAQAKLDAMGLRADFVVSAIDESVGVQKPDPKGLSHILNLANCVPENALMVGDREDRDGAAAARLGMAFLLRSSSSETSVSDFADPRLAALSGLET